MTFPWPSFGPPPMPEAATPWLVVKLVGRPLVELAWAGCYWCGFASCALCCCTILTLIQFARRRP